MLQLKVFSPCLVKRVEQRDSLSGHAIDSRDFIRLMKAAIGTLKR